MTGCSEQNEVIACHSGRGRISDHMTGVAVFKWMKKLMKIQDRTGHAMEKIKHQTISPGIQAQKCSMEIPHLQSHTHKKTAVSLHHYSCA